MFRLGHICPVLWSMFLNTRVLILPSCYLGAPCVGQLTVFLVGSWGTAAVGCQERLWSHRKRQVAARPLGQGCFSEPRAGEAWRAAGCWAGRINCPNPGHVASRSLAALRAAVGAFGNI